ncbi:hypothetical protein MUO14_20795 [Halobacillus shinanisalinarum]|uniref:Uncharacterized protein n=1 Tax=Halobacillus shinanisalinarum TaxID=2932258 RepID=A0ABY4GY42_9BACI|nr:hypothetical protein [Halobacillus shinanisalinarum]UOQ92823.1 hypothetical protein MUO14_20795 [Halobacillus shinanisalinarum]
MVSIIYNCFHWIGYHCIQHLLQDGREVIGIDKIDTQVKEHLYMSVGRNSNFQHFSTGEDRENHSHQSYEDQRLYIYNDMIEICPNGRTSNRLCVELPQLYGEWMDIQADTYEEFRHWVINSRAVYVEDFIKEIFKYVSNGDVFRLDDQRFSRGEDKGHLENVWQTYQKFREEVDNFTL